MALIEIVVVNSHMAREIDRVLLHASNMAVGYLVLASTAIARVSIVDMYIRLSCSTCLFASSMRPMEDLKVR